MNDLSRKREGMYFVAVREGLSVEVSFQLRTERYRRVRHVKAKGKGLQAMGIHTKISTPRREPWQRVPATLWHMQMEPSCHLLVLPASHSTPSHLGLCSPDNSKQTGLTLGLMITDWSWEDRAAQQS